MIILSLGGFNKTSEKKGRGRPGRPLVPSMVQRVHHPQWLSMDGFATLVDGKSLEMVYPIKNVVYEVAKASS